MSILNNPVNPVDANRRRAKHERRAREALQRLFTEGLPSVNNLKNILYRLTS